MNERLTIQDLTDLLAAKHSMTKKDAEAFVKEFFLLIEQALENEKSVKIKGLGTFKLIDVDSRESVKINTGERFRIKGHTKVSFSPDTGLRDTINKPFAHFETVVLNENTLLEDTPIEETEEEEVEEEERTEEEVSAQVSPEEVEEVIMETGIEEEAGIEEETDIEEKTEEVEIEKIEIEKAEQPEEEVTIDEQQPVTSISNKTVLVKEKSPVPYLIAVILVVLLACGSVILFIYYPDLFSSSSDEHAPDMPPVVTTQPVQPEVQLSDTIVPKEEAAPVYQDSASYKITGTKTKYTIKEGETLTKVSMRFYGTKAMWPYIVKHNPKVIKNPDNVPYGTTIEIPELTKE